MISRTDGNTYFKYSSSSEQVSLDNDCNVTLPGPAGNTNVNIAYVMWLRKNMQPFGNNIPIFSEITCSVH